MISAFYLHRFFENQQEIKAKTGKIPAAEISVKLSILFPSTHFSNAGGSWLFMHTDEHPYRSPAAVVSLRPVILRPYLSVSLPSSDEATDLSGRSRFICDEWSVVVDKRSSGERRSIQDTHRNSHFTQTVA